VSTIAQEEEGTSLETQQELGIKRAKELGFKYKVWNEGGQSSNKEDLTNRPVLLALLDEIEQSGIKHVFVFNTDRLSRNEHTWSVIRLKLVKYDVTLHTSSGVFSLANQLDKMLLVIMSEVSAYDNYLRTERSRLGKIKRIQQGYWMGGPPPFGYFIEEKKLVPNPDEKKWVKFIFNAYRDKKSTRHIKNQLLINGVKTRRGNAVWSLGSIEKLLTNKHYGGFYYVTDKKTQETISVECPPILSSTLILQVEKERASRTRQTRVSESNLTHFYLLRDFLFCEQCGSRYSGRFFPKQYRSIYYCPRLERNFVNESTDREKKCDNRRYLKIEETDKLVWDTVVEVLERSHHFKEEIRTQVFGASSTHSNKQEELKTLKRKLKKLDTAYVDATATVVNLETDGLLKRRNALEVSNIMKNVETYRMEIHSERETLRQQIYSIENQTRWVDWMSKFGDRINQMSDFTPEEKKNFLRGVIDRIGVTTLDKQTHELHLRFRIPYVNDSLVWKSRADKAKGYTIKNGVSDISVEIDTGKKFPKLKK
jgi:DNA invertase Pin-like site-specific DNA recombinase